MRKVFRTLGFLAVLSLTPPMLSLQSFGQDCTQFAADYRLAVISISVERTRRETGAVTKASGTAVIVSRDGYALCAYHVVAGDADTDDVRVFGAIGSLHALKGEMRVVSEDKSSDIALLQFKDNSRLYVPIPLGNPFKVQIGAQLCSLSFSYPLNADYHPTTGTLSSRTGQDDSAGVKNLWTTQMPSNSGESGPPVLDLNNGGVVALKYGGVVALKNPSSDKSDELVQNVNYLVPINLAEPMLRKYVGLSVAQGWKAEKYEERERSKIGEWKGNSTYLQHDVGRDVGEEWFMSTSDDQGWKKYHSKMSIELAPGHYRLESILNCVVEDERGTVEQIDDDATHRYFIEKGKGQIEISIGHSLYKGWHILGSAALTSVLQNLSDNQFQNNNRPCNGKYQTLSFDFTVKKLEKYELRVQSGADVIFEVERPEEPSKLFKYHKYGRVSASLRRISLFRLQ